MAQGVSLVLLPQQIIQGLIISLGKTNNEISSVSIKILRFVVFESIIRVKVFANDRNNS